MNRDDLKELVGKNQIGWWAIQHTEGWWIGDESGVTCYKDTQLARADLTIAIEREGGERVFELARFTGANATIGEHTPKKSYEEAMENLS